ncbi:hypothetical protein MNU24_03735 [Spiroplasma poulsonii]|nr:hypothetical protein [Spiroplasma poulsonii]UNF62577.1 hypothetical protein MNU24_03735 [Spiroplasma poulsonii]
MIILLIKLLLLMLLKLQSNAQKRQNNLILVKEKHNVSKHKYYRTRNQKLLQQVFCLKNMIMLYLKNQKSQF